MTQDRVGPAGQDRPHPSALIAEARVADGINTTMKTVEASGGNAISDGARGHPERIQLMHRDHPVLAPGNPSDGTVPAPLGGFFRHIRNK